MITKGELSISKTTGNLKGTEFQGEWITIELWNRPLHGKRMEIRVQMADFAKALTGQQVQVEVETPETTTIIAKGGK